MKLALVGATGLVGKTALTLLSRLPVTELIPVASERSLGQMISFNGKNIPVQSIERALKLEPDVAIFSAGSEVSKKYAPLFSRKGCYVIDNSSAWRMDENVPLVVPEINDSLLTHDKYLIANPNCSTIQMVMVLHPIARVYGLKKVIVSTYQSVTGTGYPGLAQLISEREEQEVANPVYPYPIDLNCIPHCDRFLENDYSREEMKLVNESRKIMDLPDLPVHATAVRIPVIGGHSESVYIELEKSFDVDDLRSLLERSPGIKVLDDPHANLYPMPAIAHNKDDVFVGRIRKDLDNERGLGLWIVADNLRKGAAINAIQIAEIIHQRFIAGVQA